VRGLPGEREGISVGKGKLYIVAPLYSLPVIDHE